MNMMLIMNQFVYPKENRFPSHNRRFHQVDLRHRGDLAYRYVLRFLGSCGEQSCLYLSLVAVDYP
jgi:hypothetical protein